MLTQEEVTAFLALLLSFYTNTSSSARNMAALFAVQPITMARWLRAARGQEGNVSRLYHYRVAHIIKAIHALDAWHARTSCYTQIASQIDPTQKIKLMRETMALALSASK